MSETDTPKHISIETPEELVAYINDDDLAANVEIPEKDGVDVRAIQRKYIEINDKHVEATAKLKKTIRAAFLREEKSATPDSIEQRVDQEYQEQLPAIQRKTRLLEKVGKLLDRLLKEPNYKDTEHFQSVIYRQRGNSVKAQKAKHVS